MKLNPSQSVASIARFSVLVATIGACSGLTQEERSALDAAEQTAKTELELGCEELAVVPATTDAARDAATLVCDDDPLQNPATAQSYLDTLRPDELAAGNVLIQCVRSTTCTAANTELGAAEDLVGRLRPSELRAAVVNSGLPQAVAERWLVDVELARTAISQAVTSLSETDRGMYVDRVRNARGKITNFVSEFSDVLAEFEALEGAISATPAAESSEELLEEIRRLRDPFVERCANSENYTLEECLVGPVARPLTFALAQRLAATGQLALAQVEADLLRVGPDASTLSVIARLAPPALDPVFSQELSQLVGEIDRVRGSDQPHTVKFRDFSYDRSDFLCVVSDFERLDMYLKKSFQAECPEVMDGDRDIENRDAKLRFPADYELERGAVIEAWIDANRDGVVSRVYDADRVILWHGPFRAGR